MPAVCLDCSRVPGVVVLEQVSGGDCVSCGVRTLDHRVVISDEQLELVKPYEVACPLGHRFTVYPYQLHRATTNATGERAAAEVKCPRCRRRGRR